MASETKPTSQPNIAHILCMDIVDYSKLLIDEQKESMSRLGEIVRNTQEFRRNEAAEKLIRIPTGDGMAHYARTGEKDLALPLIERLLKTPGAVDSVDYSITLNDLKFRWEWDPLRGDPRFHKLIARERR